MSRKHTIIPQDEATAILPIGKGKPIVVIGTASIRETFDDGCLQQSINSRLAPGVTDLVLNPDGHLGYGAPVGCVMVSPTHIYPGPVGVDIKCSMSLLQMNLPADEIEDRSIRKALIAAVCRRIPTTAHRDEIHFPLSRKMDVELGKKIVTEGASPSVCDALAIPQEWASYCEDSVHFGHDDSLDALRQRLELLFATDQLSPALFVKKMSQLGSYGGGNHFGECEVVKVVEDSHARNIAEAFGLQHDHVAFLSHCGSRGFGHKLALHQFMILQHKFTLWNIPLPGGDRELVYAPLGTKEADDYLDDMALAANFATINHLLINALVLEAFQELFPTVKGKLVYLISHNIARREIIDHQPMWVHRKGATRAFPAAHPALAKTPFYTTGHPILLPGDPSSGSAVMVATMESKKSCFSVNHGSGRRLGRRAAKRELSQQPIDERFDREDILTNCRHYPIDEAPAVYKDFNEVLHSVKKAGLATEVARLKARFVIKDDSEADD